MPSLSHEAAKIDKSGLDYNTGIQQLLCSVQLYNIAITEITTTDDHKLAAIFSLSIHILERCLNPWHYECHKLIIVWMCQITDTYIINSLLALYQSCRLPDYFKEPMFENPKRVKGQEVHLCNHNHVMLGIMRVCIICSGHCYLCYYMCEWAPFVLYPLLCQKSKLASGRLCQKSNLANKELKPNSTAFHVFIRCWSMTSLVNFNFIRDGTVFT